MPSTLDTSRSAHVPTSRTLNPDGTHLIANGLDLARRYDGFTIENAGLPAVTHGSFSAAGSGAGSIDGKYYFGVQYEDDEGYQGNLSTLLSFTAASDNLVTYSNVPVSGDPRVAKRRIYRGRQSRVLYLDATINDNSTTSTTSSKTNTQLVLQTVLSILNPDGTANARRFGRPPNFMQQVLYHQDRTFWALPLRYNEGMAQVTASSQSVVIVGGTVKNSFVGRRFSVEGVATEYIVTAASPSANTIRLSVAYASTTNAFSRYAVYPPKENWNGVYPCCDESTEILTKRGWLSVDEIRVGDEALTVNPATQKAEWNFISHLHVRPFSGRLNRWKNLYFDALTTDNHRWLARGCGQMGGHWTLRQNSADKTHFTTTGEAQSKQSKWLVIDAKEGVGDVSVPVYEDEFVELVGWYITEGTPVKVSGARIYQSAAANPDCCDRLRELVSYYKQSGCSAAEYGPYKRGTCPDIAAFHFGPGIGDRIRAVAPDKRLTPEFLLQLTSSQLEILFKAIVDGDGSWHPSAGMPFVYQKNRAAIDAIQMLASMMGRRSVVRLKKPYHSKTTKGVVCDMYQLGVYRRGRSANPCKMECTGEAYNGRVWCPTTANGTWMARRNGYTYFTGNSYGGEPESVNPADRINVESDLTNEEDLTGMFRFGSFIYLATASNLFKWTFRTDPALGAIDPHSPRGLINWRCASRAEGFVYLIDRHGAYRFNGGLDDSIGAAVEDYFLEKIVWDQQKWFHATANETEGCVRFFVCLDGSYYPKHALCYSYTTGQWWEETYPWEIAASTTVPAPVARKLICGTTQARVLVMDAAADGPTKKQTGRYSVISSSVLRVTVSSADWLDADYLNAPIEIVEGTGIKQQRRILQADKANGRLWIDRPWLTKPDTTSVVQVGGIHYTLVTKTFTNSSEGSGSIRLQVDPTQNEQTMDAAIYEGQAQTATTSQITRSVPAEAAWTKGSEWGRTRLKKARSGSNWDGVVKVSFATPVSGRSPAHSRHTQIALDGCANQEPVVIHSAAVEGVE